LSGGGKRYREVKGAYNKMCQKKKREEIEKWEEIARKERTEEHVWEVVNRERERRGSICGKIREEEWIEYFKGVLEEE